MSASTDCSSDDCREPSDLVLAANKQYAYATDSGETKMALRIGAVENRRESRLS